MDDQAQTKQNDRLTSESDVIADAPVAEEAAVVESMSDGAISKDDLERHVIEALKTVYDPEIPINIYDLGLIYEITVRDDRSVYIKMTLTAPNCPAAEMLPQQVEQAAANVPDVTEARVQLTFDPPFTQEMMSDEARLALGFM